MAAVNNGGWERGEQITYWPRRLIIEEKMSKPETMMRAELGLIANRENSWFAVIITRCNFSKMHFPSKHHGREKWSKKTDREVVVAEWHSSSLLLLPAWSVNQSLASFFAFPAFCWGQLRAVQKEGGGIHHLFIRPKPRLLNAVWDRAEDNPISQLRFNPATFPWFHYFWTERCRKEVKKTTQDAGTKTVAAHCRTWYIWDRWR